MKMRGALLACMLLLAPLASAYYHFIVYQLGPDSRVPLVTRFDTSVLPGNRLPLLIRETGAAEYAPGDNFTSLVSQVRAAAEAWNTVSTSNLKIAFGGLSSESRPMASPHIEVVFDEMPDGVIALGGPTNRLDPVTTSYGSFVPIVKSLVVLRANLATPVRPVYTERFFLTLVHEIGHALGLQHSWSGGVMSTEITRTTSKGSPLSLDDAIGLSILYPAESFRSKSVSISGRVAIGNAGVHLASVTAITASGPAVSTLTGLDGSYKLEGLPPGSYYLYAQPLPPSLQGEPQPVNITLPADPADSSRLLLPGPRFDTAFFPAATSTPVLPPNQFTAGVEYENYSFSVRARDRVNLHSVQTYTFAGQEAIKPATMVPSSGVSPLILFGYGMSTGTAPMPGLGVSLLDARESIAPGGIKAYASGPYYIQLDIQKFADAQPGHRHLIFSLNGETHVAPSALRIQARQAPVITSVVPNADGTLTIEGGPFQEGSSVLFDGARGTVRLVEDGRLTVAPPAAPFAHKGIVAVLNPDGQSTLMTLGAKSPVYAFETAVEPTLEFSPATLPAGVETVVELTATGMKLTAGSVQAAFGSSDVTFLKLIPLSDSKALVQVAISGQAMPGAVPVAVWTGLRRTVAGAQLQIGAATTAPYVAMSRISGGKPYPGGELIVPVMNLPQSTTLQTVSAAIGGIPAALTEVDAPAGVVRIAIPASVTPGPASLQLIVGGRTTMPAFVVIEPAPPQVVKAQTWKGIDLSPGDAHRAGDLIQVVVRNLPDLGVQPDLKRFSITSGTLDHAVVSAQTVAGRTGEYNVFIVLSASTPSDPPTLPLTVHFDGKSAGTITIPVR